MRGQPAAFAVSWRVIEPSAKSKHFTLPSRKKKIPAETYPRALRLRLFTKATERRSNGAAEQQLPLGLRQQQQLFVLHVMPGVVSVQGLQQPPLCPGSAHVSSDY